MGNNAAYVIQKDAFLKQPARDLDKMNINCPRHKRQTM